MKEYAGENYLKAHRRKSGLTQRDVGSLVGYRNPGQVSRHEQSQSLPPLVIALAYELIFRVPVSAIFVGIHGTLRKDIEHKLEQLETELWKRDARGRSANLTAQKLVWLNERKGQEPEPTLP